VDLDTLINRVDGLTGLTYAEFPCTPGRLALPDVACDLIWTGSDVLFVGPMSRGRIVDRAFRKMGVLTIGASEAERLVNRPLSELTDITVPIGDLVPHLANPLTDLFGLGGGARLVTPRVARGGGAGDVSFAARALSRGARPGWVADKLGMTGRHLRRRFNGAFGLSPEQFGQILRLRHAIGLVRAGQSLAMASALSGYADQPHLNRQCRTLTGLSPTEAIARLGGMEEVVAQVRDEKEPSV
jgi:AraC-like DNA-binding protein